MVIFEETDNYLFFLNLARDHVLVNGFNQDKLSETEKEAFNLLGDFYIMSVLTCIVIFVNLFILLPRGWLHVSS